MAFASRFVRVAYNGIPPAQKGARDSSVSMGPDALAHKGKVCSTAPQRAKNDESGANWNRALGKGVLTLADPPLAMDGCLAGVPCLYCAQLRMPNYPNIWTGALSYLAAKYSN